MRGGRRPGMIAAALLALAACGGPRPEPVTWPVPAGGAITTDPARQAINGTAFGFARPDTLAGRPAEAAELLAQAEFLTVELAIGPRWIPFAPGVRQAFVAARPEWRAAGGIASDAAPQAAIDALLAGRAALLAGNRAAAVAALSPPVFPAGGEDALARLSALPRLPLSARAGSDAQSEMWRDQVQIESDP